MLAGVSRGDGAKRGAMVGAVWASALLSLLAFLKATQNAHGIFTLANPLYDPKAFSTSPTVVVAASVVAAAVVGAGLGLVAVRMTSTASARALLLVLASVPSLYVLLVVALTIIWVPQAAREDFTAVLLVPVGSLLYAAYGMVMVVPVAALPAALAALMLEGWTRPESQGQGGMANPRVRRWSLGLVAVVAVTLAAMAVSRWPKS